MSPSGDGWFGRPILRPAKEPPLPQIQHPAGHPPRKHRIQYRHIIDWLIRKPGAFENYRYREELFPTTRFRMAYDQLRQHFTSSRASKDYLQILQYAARLSESAVNTVLGQLLRSGELPTLGAVEVLLQLSETPPLEDVHIDEVELTAYDHLLDGEQEVVQC